MFEHKHNKKAASGERPKSDLNDPPVGPENQGTAAQAASQDEAKIEVPLREYEDLKQKVQELEGLREKLLRAAADFENAKKRNAREKEEFLRFSQERILKEILPVLDNFERALDHVTTAAGDGGPEDPVRQNFKTLASGVQQVQKQLIDILKVHGLTRLSVLGQRFDPHRHEVVGQVAEEGPEDIIVDELEPGYMFHDRLLRAAKVRVRVPPQGTSPQGQEAGA